jgi:hypothetical protein
LETLQVEEFEKRRELDALGLPYEEIAPKRARKLLGPPDRY